MAKKVTIPYSDKTYTLEFNRRTASVMEKQGFKINELTDLPATMIPLLFHGAFLMHHPNVKGEVKERIFEQLRGRTKLIQALAEMYVEAYNSLFDDGDEDADEGNPGWGMME